jgi:hypothetical protein
MRYLFAITLLFILSSCNNYGKKLKYGDNDLFYTTNVTEDQAKKLGDVLEKSGFWANGGRKSVQLDKSADTFLFRMVVLDKYKNDSSFIEKAKTSITELSQNAFNSEPVVMHFCDDHLKTIRVVRL